MNPPTTTTNTAEAKKYGLLLLLLRKYIRTRVQSVAEYVMVDKKLTSFQSSWHLILQAIHA
jgi:hypothetical protein